jgi:hypothetical protein
MVVKVGIGSLFFTPQGEKPFGSWRENHELDINAKIATRQLLSSSPRPCCNCSVFSLVFFFSPCRELLKLSDSYFCINKPLQLLEVDESSRLGSLTVPPEIASRVTQHLESHSEECTALLASASPYRDLDDLNVPEWPDDW